MMSLYDAAKLLGGDVSRDQILCPGPGHSKRDRSLSVKFSPGAQDGFVCTSFANDDFKACRDHVKAVLGIDRTRAPVQFAPIKYKDDADNVKIALRLWDESMPLAGTLAETYLRSRGITDIEVENLRFHPDLKSDRKSFPGMVGLYRNVFTDQPCGIHRTFLTADAHKITRKMLGRAHQAAIKLDPDADITTGLHIGEGIETVMTGRQFRLSPAWAATSVGAIGDFPVLPGIETLTILGEMDESGTSEREGRKCARRWLDAGAHVQLVTPKHGKDLNDAIRGEKHD